MSKILITGGAGFVGTNLIHHLRQISSDDVCVVDNERLGSRDRLKGYDVEFHRGDVRDLDLLRRLCGGKDLIVHLAADTRVMDSTKDPVFNFENNAIGTLNVLLAAREAGVARVIAASTGGAILGEVPPPVHEGQVPSPVSPYGASKLAAEGYMSAFSQTYGMSTCSLRFSNIYGPRSSHKGSVVAHFFKQIRHGRDLIVYGDGTQTRDYLFVGDLVTGIHAALRLRATGVYQLGCGYPTSVNELIAAMRETVGDEYRQFAVVYEGFREGEIRNTWCDISKARRELGFSPMTSLSDGLTATWSWFSMDAAGGY